jgi:hypothetical protein
MTIVLLKRVYAYRQYPAEKLPGMRDLCRELSHAMLQERCNAYYLKVKRHPSSIKESFLFHA